MTLGRGICLNYLHRLGFALSGRRSGAEGERRTRASSCESTRCCAPPPPGRSHDLLRGRAHFYADVDLRGKWVLQGEPALVGSTTRYGEKATTTRPSAWRPEVEAMELDGYSCAEPPSPPPSVARQPCRAVDHHLGHGPATAAIPCALLGPRPTSASVWCAARLSPDFNPDEAIGWIREEVTANPCFGPKAKVSSIRPVSSATSPTTDEVKRRCRRTASQADALAPLMMPSAPTRP